MIADGVAWSLFDPETERSLPVPEGSARPTLDVKPGTWTVRAERGGDAAVATIEESRPAQRRTVRVVLPEARPAASLSVEPENPRISQEVAVTWDGPGADGDYVTVVEPEADEGSLPRLCLHPGGANPLTLALPDRAGTWEIRYVASDGGGGRRRLGRGRSRWTSPTSRSRSIAPEDAAAGDTGGGRLGRPGRRWRLRHCGGAGCRRKAPTATTPIRGRANPLDIRLPEERGRVSSCATSPAGRGRNPGGAADLGSRGRGAPGGAGSGPCRGRASRSPGRGRTTTATNVTVVRGRRAGGHLSRLTPITREGKSGGDHPAGRRRAP